MKQISIRFMCRLGDVSRRRLMKHLMIEGMPLKKENLSQRRDRKAVAVAFLCPAFASYMHPFLSPCVAQTTPLPFPLFVEARPLTYCC